MPEQPTIEALIAYAGQLSEAAAQASAASEKQYQIINGNAQTDVSTESGPVPTLAKQAVQAQEKVTAVLIEVASRMAGPMPYGSIAEGLLNTVSGGYFNVVSPEVSEITIMYMNNAGAPVEVKRASSAAADSLLLNAGKDFPLRAVLRDEAISAAIASVNAAFLNIRVLGARAGKLYRLEWVGSGINLSGSIRYEMLFTEYDKAGYATLSATGAVNAIQLGDIPATTIEAGAVITRSFKSTRIPGLEFLVTYKPGSLPVGGSVALNNSNGAGYSWIIDESCYFPAPVVTVPQDVLPMAYSVSGTTSREVQVAFRMSSVHDMRLTLKKSGINAIYNSVVVDVATHGGTPPTLSRVWTNISSGGSDWFGPYRVRAVANGDAAAEAFTGGAHGSDGNVGGVATAELLSVEIAVDGVILGGTAAYAGTCREVAMTWTNGVQGYNTKAALRKILEETMNLRITQGSIQVHGEFKALEAIEVRRYYGLQSQSNGFQSSVHFVGGQQSARFTPAANTDYNAGAKSAYPSVPVIGMRSTTGEFWMWPPVSG